MGSKLDWSDKAKIWELHHLKNTPIDRIRGKFSTGRDAIAPSWDTVRLVVEEFRSLSQAQVRQLPDALQERWRELQSEAEQQPSKEQRVEQKPPKETSHEQQTKEREKLIALVQQWREELANHSPVNLLQGWLDKAHEDAQTRFYADEDVEMLYSEARRPHDEPLQLRPFLQVENDPTFGLLQQKFPDPDVWTAFQAWCERKIPYVRAFYQMLKKIECLAVDAWDSGAAELVKKGVEGVD